jgi:hypothetical protein
MDPHYQGKPSMLIHYAGRVDVTFGRAPGSVEVSDLKPFIDHAAQTVASSTGELRLDYGKGLLTLNAARAQGASGALHAAGRIETRDLTLASDLELGHIVVVSLDDQPLGASGRMLLQVMSEERASDFRTEDKGQGVKRIVNIGADPWLVKELKGTVSFKRAVAARLKVTALDFNGYPAGSAGTAEQIKLQPRTVYYLVAKQPR